MGRNIEAEITRLAGLNLRALRAEWDRRLGDPIPTCKSTDILHRILACRIQEQALCGLSPDTRNRVPGGFMIRSILGGCNRIFAS